MSESASRTAAWGGRASWTFGIVAIVLAAVFVRLGVWQLDRLAERRAENRVLAARMDLAPADLAATLERGALAENLEWRRFRVAGTWDLDHEIVVRGRSHRGTPGIHVVTPLLYGPGSAVLVLRGWLPAADGLSADLAGARPVDTTGAAVVQGLALGSEPPSPIPSRRTRFPGAERLVLGSLSVEQAAESVPYELLPVFLLASAGAGGSERAVIVQEPAPSDGPHLWYALQWFGFALISLAGSLLYIRTLRRSAAAAGGEA